MILELGTEKIPCKIEKTRGRRTNISFRNDQSVLIIRTPGGKFTPQVQEFLYKNEAWILKNFKKQKGKLSQRDEFLKKLDRGIVPYLGETYGIEFLLDSKRWVQREEEEKKIYIYMLKKDSPEMRMSLLYGALRSLAKSHLERRTIELAKATDSKINQIRTKDLKSKWGSCSSKRNINLNWHLILLPPPIVDYVIIHELMHLREMNHSASFWNWVAHYYPKYKMAEKSLKQNQWMIGVMEQ
ncbi:MAG: SprT family zinc-dependent metalloprotease [Bacteroidia bacterium]|nr:SprT family zinc-dependent metalloprotease [Bacteroidia bacterium]